MPGAGAGWRLAAESRAVEAVRVRKFVSERSGLTLVVADVEGPVVNGFFALATEAHDDDGLPHTLEHLVFLGSKRYPYKGILDLLANRCLANGTNAWTDTDHTCYTIRTAGATGMLTLLPIYLDHILNPTLTEHGFTTEVHHIDNEGEDAGVVYCEMQGRENMADSRCHLTLIRNIYPNHGYSSETGGIMENLRTSTDNEKVRAYHKKFYRPENLTIILTGQINPKEVFKALEVVEDDIIAKNAQEAPEPWERPWQSRPPPPHYGELKVEWPADAEDCGQVLLGWTGPTLDAADSLKQLGACAVLLRYLCDTPTAPLQRDLVEKEDAIAGDISFNIRENLTSLLIIELDNVPISKIEMGRTEALECLKKLRRGEEPLDMTRMNRLLKKQLRENLASLESDPHHAIAFHCIGDMLYSRNEEDFVTRLNSHKILSELMSEPQEYWRQLLQTYFGDELVVILGHPSIDLQTKMAEKEKKRIEAQRQALGPEGLAEKEKVLREALDFNEREPPAGTMSDVPIPPCNELNCYNVSTWTTGDPCPHLDLSAMPIYTRAHAIPTNFVYMDLVFDLTEVDQLTRKWLPTIVASWGECPVKRGGETIPYQQVVSELEELSVKYDNQIGFGKPGNFSVGHFSNHAYIEVTCEQSTDYVKLVDLLWEMLHTALITKDRLLVIAQRLINDVAQVRRRGNKMASDILRDSLYSKDSNIHWCSVLRQQQFLTELVEKLNAGGDMTQSVLAEAEKAYKEISSKVWLHLATDLDRYKPSSTPWARWTKENEIEPMVPKLSWDAELMSGWGGGCVVGVGGVESNYLVQLCPGPLSFTHADLPPLLIVLNYFTQLEGPMWRLIRGCGLAYGYGIVPIQNEGRLLFSLYKATNVVGAYCKAKSIIEEYLSGGVLEPDLFESAKSCTIFEVVDDEKCPADVARGSLYNYFRRADDTYSKKLVCSLMAVSAERAQEVAARWLPTLFDHTLSKTTVVCHPSKVQETKEAFQKIGVNLEAYESIESSHFNK